MRFLKKGQADWTEFAPLADTEGHPDERAWAAYERAVRSILLTDNLVVLAGSGASMEVTGEDGKRLAPSMGELWEEAQAVGGESFEAILKKVKYQAPEHGDDIESLLSQCLVFQQFDPSDDIEEFVRKTEKRVVDRCRFADDGADLTTHEAFLRRLVRRSPRAPRAKIFTTNYDLCFERAASKTRFIAVDGFTHSLPQNFDGTLFDVDFVRRSLTSDAPDYVPGVFQLFKLHGSVDWIANASGVERRRDASSPLIIYPRTSKFERSFQPPFFELMARFQLALRQPNTAIIVIGFGFRDPHLVEPIQNAIRSNVNLQLLLVDADFSNSNEAAVQFVEDLIRKGDGRLALLEATFGEFVTSLPDVISVTESERHHERLLEGE